MTQDHPPDTDVRALVERIVRALVDRPDSIRVVATEGQHATVLEVLADDPGVIGQAVGRHGIYAEAIRTLLSAIGGKHRRRYILEDIE